MNKALLLNKPPRSAAFKPGFFNRNAVLVARDLIGCSISTNLNGVTTSGMITEVEAYCGESDAACHAAVGRTKRNEVLFWDGGFCYIYLIYGLHYCANVVTETAGQGSAVLIRAIEPIDGLDEMFKRRRTLSLKALSNGPGKVCEALGITSTFNGEHFCRSDKIRLSRYKSFPDDNVIWTPRIGITKAVESPWRAYLKESKFITKSPFNSKL